MTTVRTIKLKRSSQAYGGSSSEGDLSAPATTETAPDLETAPPPAHPDEPSTAPAPEAVAPRMVPGKSTVWFMLIALFATIGLLVILGLQFSEMSFFKDSPSAWVPGK